MITLLASAWRIVVNRSLADWLILSAAAVTVLVATTLLAAGPIYADAVTLSGVQRTLADAPVQEVNAEVTIRTNAERYLEHDALVQQQVATAFNATGGALYRRGVSESYALPFQEDPENVRNLTVAGFFDDLENRVTLLDGTLPDESPEPYQMALSDATAGLLGLNVGDEIQITNRRVETFQPRLVVSGIFRIDDPTDPYWLDERLDIEGVTESESFATYGPLVVHRDVFFNALTPQSGQVSWRVLPTFGNLTIGELGGLQRNVEALEERLNRDTTGGTFFAVHTDLDGILRRAERSLLVTRSGVLVLTIQMAVLAGYALLLTAGLLVDQRRVETALIRSRGADNRQIATMAAMEGVLIALPAVLLGPPLAALALHLLNWIGPLADIGLEIQPRVSSTSYLLALGTGLACVVALTLPALFAARSFSGARAERGRQGALGFAQRTGLDIVLVILAGIGFWQLRRYDAPITETVEGRLGIDPLLVAAPAIGLLAGAVIALRTIPLLARLSELIATGGRKIVPALSAWQVARRPMRYARSALLLILALGIGLFAVSYSETWKLSQGDQADYQVGADLRVIPNQRVGRSIPRHALPDAYSQIEGVQAAIPVSHETGQLSRSAGSARAILLDTSQAADIVQFRPDLGSEPLSDLMSWLTAGRPTLQTVQLPSEPATIGVDVQLAIDPLPEDVDPEDRQVHIQPALTMVIQDAAGLLFRAEFGVIPESDEPVRLTAPIHYTMTNGAIARPIYPLSLVAIEVRTVAPRSLPRTATLELGDVLVTDEPESADWTPAGIPPDRDFWTLEAQGFRTTFEAPEAEFIEPTGGATLAIALNSGYSTGNQVVPIVAYLRPAGTELPETIPVLVSEAFLEATASSVGDRTDIQVGDLRGTVEIAGVVSGFPTAPSTTDNLLIADLATVAMRRFEPGRPPLLPDEIWVSANDVQIGEIATALRQEPYLSRQVDGREERTVLLLADPVALGTIGALAIGFVAAAIFAGIGFVVSAIVSARERLTEFALLRALGLSPRQLVRWMSVENGILLVMSLIGGTLLGLALAWLVLPLISVTQQATRVVPEVIVIIPWRTIILLELTVIIILAIIAVGLALVLRRVGLGSLLRLGGDG